MVNKKTKILVVDDEPINIRIIEEMLVFEEEYICRGVTSGKQCLAILDEYQPEVILLDVMMPVVSGHEVCRIIKTAPKYSSIRIIMISGRALPSERQAGIASGADDYLAKPFDEDELLAAIKGE